jgi:preprotein translocase subunit Sss1
MKTWWGATIYSGVLLLGTLGWIYALIEALFNPSGVAIRQDFSIGFVLISGGVVGFLVFAYYMDDNAA